MNKQIKIEDLKWLELQEALKYIPIGGLQSIIVSRKPDGTELRKEYRKLSNTHVELVRNYEYS